MAQVATPGPRVASTPAVLRLVDAEVEARRRARQLVPRREDQDPLVPGRTVERLQQYHEGVPVWGGEVVRDSAGGVPVSLLVNLAEIDGAAARPALSEPDVRARLSSAGQTELATVEPMTLFWAADQGGSYRLVYTGILSSSGGAAFRVFIDATTAQEVFRINEFQSQAAVGTGRGVLGDQKKISVSSEAGAYFADDQLRPPQLRTFDMRDALRRTIDVVGGAPLFASDRATDSDNVWADPVAVDAHVNIGWTYDYFSHAHGREGLDGRNRPITTLINGLSSSAALSVSSTVASTWAFNAFWCGTCGPARDGVMFFGNGIPDGYVLVSSGQHVAPLAGALDITAHELTHGVTDSSSRLTYRGESGALNEAFSDIMGTSVEFYYQTPGSGVAQADYLIGEDVFRGRNAGSLDGIRSMSDPGRFGDPDHYSRRYTGQDDDGGVHINSGIANHAFYLAVEGGVNRTSGLPVRGVGSQNRLQMERVFYRAFVFLLPSEATFSTARAATILAARDLYGAGSEAERAITEAWTAVGVF